MIKTIFRNTFLVGVSVLLLCILLFFAMQYRQTEDGTYAALQQEASYAERGLMLSGVEYLESLGDINRITWIDAQGEVLYDSEITEPIQNQKDCKEVAQAFLEKEGRSKRKSESSGKSSMYYAILCEDGSVLRLSRPLSAVREAFVMVSPVLWILVLVILISGVLAFRVARQIVDPINNMDIEHPDENIYPELAPLIDKIEEQRLTIQEETIIREQMRREFTANVSHELKTPVAAISGLAEKMAEGDVEKEKVQDFSKDIYKESQRLMALIDDITKLSQLDEEAIEPGQDQVDLYELSCDVVNTLKPVAKKNMVKLKVEGKSVCVPGVAQLLNEMVYNLCDNAIKYNRRGGKVTVSVVSGKEDVRLSVADTGIGIAAEHQKRVFERFYRVDKTHSQEIGGTGLGLSIVKHGAQLHNAKVEMTSEEGVGTTITLIFPVQKNAEPENA